MDLTKSNHLSVSVVICTYNRAACIGATLDALRQLRYPNFEVVVVNGPSTDRTREVLEKYSDFIHYCETSAVNLACARNEGIRNSAGEIIAFLDDDAIPESCWLTKLVAAYKDEDVGAAGGFVYDQTGFDFQTRYIVQDRLGKSLHFETPVNYEQLSYPGAFYYPGLLGANSSFRRSAVLKVGGFDELYAYYLDETDLTLRLVDAGYRVEMIPDARVHHKASSSGQRHYRARFRSQAYFVKKNTRVPDPRPCTEIIHPEIIEAIGFLTKLCSYKMTSEDEVILGESEIYKGVAEGEASARLPRKLLTYFEPPRRAVVQRDREEPLSFCIFSQEFPPQINGGIARWNKELADALVARGNEVHVITKTNGRSSVDFEEGVWIHRLSINKIPKDLFQNSKILAASDKISHLPPGQALYSLYAYHELLRFSDRIPISLAISPIWDLEGAACLTDPDIPQILTLQTTYKLSSVDHPEWTNNKDLNRDLYLPMIEGERKALVSTKALQAISQGIVESIESSYQLSFDKEQINLFPIGLKDRFHSYPQREPDGKVRVLFVGRFEARKGINILLTAIRRLSSSHPELEFILAGDASLKTPDNMPYIDYINIIMPDLLASGVVKVTGKLSDEEIFSQYAACDIFVAPSRFESFGIVFVEAMSFGKPVIGPAIGGVPSIITDRHDGLLVQPGSDGALAAALAELATNHSLRDILGQNARRTFLEKFTSDKMAENYEKVARKLAKTAPIRADWALPRGKLAFYDNPLALLQ